MKYISRIFKTGAVRKTPSRVIRAILSEVKSADHVHIIEFGAGQGEITKPLAEEIASRKDPVYFAFELDKNFSSLLKQDLQNVTVLAEDAFAYEDFIPDHFKADVIISSLPLSFYPRESLHQFLESLQLRLRQNGKLIILFHAFWLIPMFKRVFKAPGIRRFATFPPYFLLVFEKR
jgi:phospholipid N-methyltransferase